MFTATWQKSEPTVLLWGDRWWLPQSRLPVPFADFGQAAEVLASVWPYPVRSFRLVYQPERLATVPVVCPNGNRSTLALALGDEHPALQHPAHVWGFEPILQATERFTTLLHFETEPGLFGLVQQLHRHGLTVRTAWPMATWLNALPPELTESGALTVVALHADCWSLYRHSAAGERGWRSGTDADVPGAVADLLRDVAAKAEVEYVLFVTSDDTLLAKVEERVTLAANQVVGVHSLWDALAKPAVIPDRHPAQLLPPVPLVTPPRVVGTASLLLVAASLGLTGWQVHSHREARVAAEREAEALAALDVEIAHLRENAAEISRLRATLGEGDLVPAVSGLLRRLAAAARSGVALQTIRVADGKFVITGGVDSDARETTWSAWTKAMAVPQAQLSAGGAFEVQGRLGP